MALRIAQGQWEKYLTLELARTRNRVEDMYAIVSKFQFAKIGDYRSVFKLTRGFGAIALICLGPTLCTIATVFEEQATMTQHRTGPGEPPHHHVLGAEAAHAHQGHGLGQTVETPNKYRRWPRD